MYADLFGADLDDVTVNLDAAIRAAARRGPRGRDPVSLPVTAVWAAVWPPPVGCCGLTAGRVFCDDLSAN